MLLLGIFKNIKNKRQINLYYNWDLWHKDTFSPTVKIEKMILFKISGKTYAEKQENLRQLAIDFQLSDTNGLSWGEYAEIENFFYTNAKKYGLVREFKENAII